MKSAVPKLLHQAHGLPLIERVIRTAAALQPASIVIVVGHQGALLQTALSGQERLTFAVQEPQLGTGHALLQSEPSLQGARGTWCCSRATYRCCGPRRFEHWSTDTASEVRPLQS